MIYTVTFNPSLDYYMYLDSLYTGETNRSRKETIFPGGKGINVSMVLQRLGIPNTILGFIAGFAGDEIEARLKKAGCNTDFIRLDSGNSRINVKLLMNNNYGVKSTDVNATGPIVTKQAVEELYNKLSKLTSEDTLVLAGAVPASMPEYAYEQLMDHLNDKKITTVVDATGNLLSHTLSHHPFLIKPNRQELEQLFSTKMNSQDDIIKYAKKLIDMGAINVLVSLGSEGAILVTDSGEIYNEAAPDGIGTNTIGAGDSMIAGFIYGYETTHSIEEAFKMGIASGSACAFSEGMADKSDILALRKRLR